MNKKISFPMALIIIAIVVIVGGGILAYRYQRLQQPVVCTMEAKVCPDGSAVGRIGPNCEFALCPGVKTDETADWPMYNNKGYGFKITFPDSWKGYSVTKSSWTGRLIDASINYNGPLFIFKNPKSTAEQSWQDIPIMVFTPDVWQLISEEKIAVSAAPIPPAEIGRNEKYVFATPPRWYGFTDDLGWQEAVEIVKTFKAF
jgi:hypothetical protein